MRKLSYPLIILGLCWSIFILWNRFFRQRPERFLEEFVQQYSFFLLFLFLFFLLLFLWRIRNLLLPPLRGFSLPWLKSLLASPGETYEYLRRKTPVLWGAHWLNLWAPWAGVSTNFLKRFLFFFAHLPSLIPPLVLLLEIGWGGPLKYFYQSLILLSLPLFLRLSIYLGLREKDALFSFLREQGLVLLQKEGDAHRLTFSRDLSSEEMESMVSKYHFLLHLESFFQDIQYFLSLHRYFSSILEYYLYSLAWGFLVFQSHLLTSISLDQTLPFLV